MVGNLFTSFSQTEERVKDYANTLTVYQKGFIQSEMDKFESSTGIEESLVIANQFVFAKISDSLSLNYKSLKQDSVRRRILFIVDAGNKKMYVTSSLALREEFSDTIGTRMFKNYSYDLVKEIAEGDTLKRGFKSKDNSPDEDTARANIFVAFVLCIVGFCVLMLITLFLVVR